MNQIAMKGYTIRSIQYANCITGTETMEIGSHVDSKVNYNDEASECVCIFSLTVKNTGEKELLKIIINIEAVFTFSPEDNKKSIHIKINDALFSQARAMVCSICGVVGLPPIVIPQLIFSKAETEEVKTSCKISK